MFYAGITEVTQSLNDGNKKTPIRSQFLLGRDLYNCIMLFLIIIITDLKTWAFS